MTPEENLERLIKEYKALTGQTLKFKTEGSQDVLNNIQLIEKAILNLNKATDELADDFNATLETLTGVQQALKGIDSTIRQKLRPEYKNLSKLVLDIRNTNNDILEGYGNEKTIQKQLNSIVNTRANLNIILNTHQNELNSQQIQHLKNVINITENTEALALQHLSIIKYSKQSSQNISNIANALETIPILGKLISPIFKDLSDDILHSSTKTQALILKIEALKKESIELSKLKPNLRGEELEKINEKIDNINTSIISLEDNLKQISPTQTLILDKFKSIFSRAAIITGAIKGVTMLFSTIKDIFIELDMHVTELARSFAMSREFATELRKHYTDLATTAGDTFLMSDDIYKTQIAYNKELGVTVNLTDQNLTALSKAREFTRLSEGAMVGLQHIMTQTGRSADDIQNSILGTSSALQIQNGLLLDQKQILEDVLSTSASIRSQFHNNIEEISKAVTQAKILGFTLKDIEGIQDNMLNFESSISSEIEAELLMNKELNIESARYYALHNDINNLQKEINKNLVKSGEYDNLNAIQKRAYAKALGLSEEKLSEIVIHQKEINNLTEIFGKNSQLEAFLKEKNLNLDKEGLANALAYGIIKKEQLNDLGNEIKNQISQLSTSQKLERTMHNIREIFTSMLDGPFGALLNGFNSMLESLNNSKLGQMILKVGMGVAIVGGIVGIGAALIRLTTMGTIFNPMWVRIQGMASGLLGSQIGGVWNSGTGLRGFGNTLVPGQGGMVGLGASLGMGIAGTGINALTNAITDQGSFADYAGNIAGSALQGAALGALLGPLGAAVGAGIGSIFGGVSTYLESQTPKMATGGIVSSPTRAIVGEKGPEAIIPLTEFNSKLDRLISAMEAKQNLYFDSRLVGDAIALRSFK